MREIWKPVNGQCGKYEVSNHGRVKSLCRYINKSLVREKILTPSIDKDGYETVSIRVGDKRKHLKVHRLVGAAFIENKNNFKTINHIDGDKRNNSVTNLEWCSVRKNIEHAFSIGLRYQDGEAHHNHKLNDSDIRKIRNLRAAGITCKKIASMFSISDVNVSYIANRKSWDHVQ